MNKPLVKTLIAGASLSLASASVMAWDVFEFSGTQQYESHLIHSLHPAASPPGPGTPGCGLPCVGLMGPADQEAQASIIIENKTSIANLGAATVSVADECYNGTDEDAGPGLDTDLVIRSHQFVHSPTASLPLPVDGINLAPETARRVINLCTNAEGKIISGQTTFCSDIAGTTCGTHDFTEGVFTVFFQGTVTTLADLPQPADVDATIADFKNGVWHAGGPYGANSDWSWAASGYLANLTCDIDAECGQLNKSVPVPAFAAAALGLGLLGITALTRRRAIVK